MKKRQHNILIPFLTLLLVVAGCKSSELPTDDPGPSEQDTRDEPVLAEEARERIETMLNAEELLQDLTLREKIGQLFTVPVNGRFLNEQDLRYQEWKHLLEEYSIGGIYVTGGDLYGIADLTNRLQALSELPLWVSLNLTTDSKHYAEGISPLVSPMGITATGNPANAFQAGAVTGREVRELGIHQVYAPLLDLHPDSVTAGYSPGLFGSRPNQVNRFGQAFIRGLESEGVMATAKFFPGQSGALFDSLLSIPSVSLEYEEMRVSNLIPFRRAIQEELSGILSSHHIYPEFSTPPYLPASLNQSILTGLLADSLGFNGIVVTGELDQSVITSSYSPGESARLALEAGADILLASPDEITAIYALEEAVRSGELDEERIDRSVRKILKMKLDQGLFQSRGTRLENLARQVQKPEHLAIADRIARESVTLLKNRGGIIPVRESQFPRILFLSLSEPGSTSKAETFTSQLGQYHSHIVHTSVTPGITEPERTEILRSAEQTDLILIGSFLGASEKTAGDHPELLALLRELTGQELPSLLITFGSPLLLAELPDADVHLAAWDASEHQLIQTVPALFGGAEIGGLAPLPIADLYVTGEGRRVPHSGLRPDRPESVGMSSDSLMMVDQIMQEAIQDSVFPGGVIAVVKDGVLVWHKGYGYHNYEKNREVVSSDVYDIASLTKVMSTTTAIMKLVEEGRIDLDDRVSDYISEYQEEEKNRVTIRHLLLHTSGLPAFRIYIDRIRAREDLLEAVKNEPLINPPGQEYVYSDLGFILLAEIVQQVSGERIDIFTAREIFEPMGMTSTHFNPASLGAWMLYRIPPTEIDQHYGRGMVHGFVNDERAYFMDGVAGHAGLFTSAYDIAKWSQMLLNRGYFAGYRFFNPETVDLFTGRQSPFNQRGYGFDRKNSDMSSAGRLTSFRTFGHLGFTGTSLWIDPDYQTTIILLTNRTFPDRNQGSGIRDVRPAISDAVVNSIIEPIDSP
ncbi:MAG: serine hydrolase [Balneolaceae bacterium]